MKYDVEADWFILNTCNFRCGYCLLHANLLRSKINVYGTNDQWADGFQATGKTWLLHVTGGEPFLYPGFVDLCTQLAKNHYLSINSNLSQETINVFADVVAPDRVHHINASLHYDELTKKDLIDVYIQRVQRLQQRHFNVLPSVIMTPNMIRRYPEVSHEFESRGVYPIPKTMRDHYQGREYPEAYSNLERTLIIRYLEQAWRNWEMDYQRMGERPTIDMFQDHRFLSGKTSYRGRLCGSGYNFVRIKPDGTMKRCGSKKPQGNILSQNTKFLRGPKPCNDGYCPYFCEKYTSPRFVSPAPAGTVLPGFSN